VEGKIHLKVIWATEFQKFQINSLRVKGCRTLGWLEMFGHVQGIHQTGAPLRRSKFSNRDAITPVSSILAFIEDSFIPFLRKENKLMMFY
jgi:hypothetical protein